METFSLIVNTFIEILSLVIIIYCIGRLRKYREDWTVILPIFFFVLHNALFYLLQIIATVLGTTLSQMLGGEGHLSGIWSVILRIHSLTAFISILQIYRNKMRECNAWKLGN